MCHVNDWKTSYSYCFKCSFKGFCPRICSSSGFLVSWKLLSLWGSSHGQWSGWESIEDALRKLRINENSELMTYVHRVSWNSSIFSNTTAFGKHSFLETIWPSAVWNLGPHFCVDTGQLGRCHGGSPQEIISVYQKPSTCAASGWLHGMFLWDLYHQAYGLDTCKMCELQVSEDDILNFYYSLMSSQVSEVI